MPAALLALLSGEINRVFPPKTDSLIDFFIDSRSLEFLSINLAKKMN